MAFDQPNLTRVLEEAASLHPDRIAFQDWRDGGAMSWGEFVGAAASVAAGFAKAGVRRGDRVALLLTNRLEFHVVDAALLRLGAVPVSIYPTAAAGQIQHVLDDASARMLVTQVEFSDLAEGLSLTDPVSPAICSVDGYEGSPLSLEQLLDSPPLEPGEGDGHSAGGDDLATLIYTSGTTGPPKGVEITHANVIAAARSFGEAIDFPEHAAVVSYLPMAHIAERNASHYLAMGLGFTVTCCPSPQMVFDCMRDVRPSWFFGVPRIWEKLKIQIEADLAGDDPESRTAREAIAHALEIVTEHGDELPHPASVQERLRGDHREALETVRHRHGIDRLRAANVGAAPSPASILRYFHSLGLPLGELWGMSETTGLGTITPAGGARLGTVGPAAPGIELAIADDDELLVRGGAVTRGYHGQPDATAEARGPAGWLHTGDTARLDDEGYLSIVGRKKELMISAAGENMSPSLIESELKAACSLIEHVCVVGDRRPFNVALIAADEQATAGMSSEEVERLISTGVERANERLARVQQVKRFAITVEPWRPGTELTPTMKVRRREVEGRFAAEIEALYGSDRSS